MLRTAEKENRPAGTGCGNFWQGKKACWEMCHCPETVRSECHAPRHPEFPCWEIEGTYIKLSPDGTSGRYLGICPHCRVYRKYGESRPIELKLFGKGVDSFHKLLDRKSGEPVLPGHALAPASPALCCCAASALTNSLKRRTEMHLEKLDEIVDKHNGDPGALTGILRDVQDEYEWLPPEALDHIGRRLGIPQGKLHRTAIFGKGLSIIPRAQQVNGHICVVDLVKHYLDFLRHDLCGKCAPCREGIQQMYETVCDITRGEGEEQHLQLLRDTAGCVVMLSACNQGSIAANIVLKALDDFQHQFEEHIKSSKCAAGTCQSLRPESELAATGRR